MQYPTKLPLRNPTRGSLPAGLLIAAGRLLLIAATPFLAALLFPGAARADIALVFGAYASDKPSAMVEQLRPTLDLLELAMSERLGEPVTIKLRVARDYETGLAELTSGRVDFARLGAASYVAAKEEAPKLSILAAERYGESIFFNGVICVATDSPIHTLGELAGKSFAFGDEQSTLGRYIAQLTLARAGITAATLKDFKYLERHDRVGAAVASGQFEAGALEETMFDKMVASGARLRQIAAFPTVTKPWVGRVGLAPRIGAAISSSLLGIRDPVALAALRFDGFATSDDSDYEVTRASIKENWRFFARPSS
jgi:phosphonate transport system substrate-binding protein